MTTAAPASDPIMMPAPRADARGAKRKAGGDALGFAAALKSAREGKPGAARTETDRSETGKAEAGKADERGRAGINIVVPPQLRFDARLEVERPALPLAIAVADDAKASPEDEDLPLLATPETDETEDAPPVINPLLVAFTAITASVVRNEGDGQDTRPAIEADAGISAPAAHEAGPNADKAAVLATSDTAALVDAPAKPLVEVQPAPPRAAAETTAVRAAVATAQPDPATVAPRIADPVTGPVASFNAALAAGSQSRSDDRSDGRSGQQNRRGDGLAARVTVVAEQSIPAPAAHVSATSTALVAGLTGDSGWHSALRSVAAMQRVSGQMNGAPVHSMKLQLHPAELGMVTADLRFSGDQLAVELKVENAEAYHRLSSDSDSIVASLKALGYDIDQVTVAQSSVANSTGGRPDAGAGTDRGSTGGNAFAASGGDGSDRNRAGGQAASRDQGRDGRQGYAGAQSAAEGNGRGLYI